MIMKSANGIQSAMLALAATICCIVDSLPKGNNTQIAEEAVTATTSISQISNTMTEAILQNEKLLSLTSLD